MDNAITLLMKRLIKDDYLDCLAGTITFSDDGCKLEERGGVYGIAVELADDEKKYFFEKHNRNSSLSFNEWKPIDGNIYPLYWGKDSNLGFRLYDHMKSRKSTATLQLNSRKYLNSRKVIYGAILCKNIANNEKLLRENYPDIFKNRKL